MIFWNLPKLCKETLLHIFTQTDGDELLHENPVSTLHVLLHPSPFARLPSSQASYETFTPFPQILQSAETSVILEVPMVPEALFVIPHVAPLGLERTVIE